MAESSPFGDFLTKDPFDYSVPEGFEVPNLKPKVPHRPGEVPSEQVYQAQNTLLKALRAYDEDPKDPNVRPAIAASYKLLNSWLKVHGN